MLKRAAVVIVLLGLGLYFFVFRGLYYKPGAFERSGVEHNWFARGFTVALVWSHSSDSSLADGANTALDEINEAKGPLAGKITLRKFEETPESIGIGREVASHEDVLAVIGHDFESTTMPSSLTYERHGVLFFSTNSSDVRLTGHEFQFVFRFSFDDTDYMTALTEYAKQKDLVPIGMLFGRADHGELASAQFLAVADELSVEVPIVRSYFHGSGARAQREQDFRPLIAEVQKHPFKSLMIADELPWAAKLIVDLKRMGVNVPLLSTYKLESADLEQELTDFGAADAANNLFVASPIDTNATTPGYLAFRARFIRLFGHPPTADAAQAYEALKLFVRAAEKSGSADPVVVATTLKTNKWPGGLFGEVAFHPNGDIIGRRVEIKHFQNGVFTTVGSEKDVE